MGSGLRAVAPRCLSRENVGRSMTVLHLALCGYDLDQTPVPILFWANIQKKKSFCRRGNEGRKYCFLPLRFVRVGGRKEPLAQRTRSYSCAAAVVVFICVGYTPKDMYQCSSHCHSPCYHRTGISQRWLFLTSILRHNAADILGVT